MRAAPTVAYPLGYSAGLDGLRGWMTVGVLLAHTGPWFPGAILYMDIFFVMSGYFITGLLLRDIDLYGRIRFGPFYARRMARIVPPLAAMLATYLIFAYFCLPDVSGAAIDALVAATWGMNLWRAGLLPFIPSIKTSYLGHTWSLSVEEQFYAIWPWMLAALVRVLGCGRRLFWAIVALATSLWLWRIALTARGASWDRLYNGTDTRADALMIGCALAVGLRLAGPATLARLDRLSRYAAWGLLIPFITLSFYFVTRLHPFYYYAGSVLCGALPGALITLILIRPTKTILHHIFEQPALTFLGKVFYGLYLWHFPILAILDWHYRIKKHARIAIGYPLVCGAALLSYILIERHFMRARTPEVPLGG